MNNNHNSKFCKFVSFNCKSVKRSIDSVRNICEMSDIVALQETWLLPHDIPFLGTISDKFEYSGKSAVDTSAGLLVGRPHGGVAILWRKGIFEAVSVLDCTSSRLAAIRADIGGRSIIIVSVYMPTDSLDNLPMFTEVLGEISAIVEGGGVECVFMLGDFNAHPHELFFRELTNFCADQTWICADIEKLGLAANNYTFISEAHGCRRWLDHCVVSLSAWQTIVKVGIEEDVFLSDHLPLYIECDLNLVRQKLTTQNVPRCSVIWGERDESQITRYHNLCNNRLRNIDFPHEFSKCSYGSCSLVEHKHVLDNLYKDIVDILCDAAVLTREKEMYWPRRAKVCGWNNHVRDAHREATLKFKMWVLHDRPTSGVIYDEMCEARKKFKGRHKWCLKEREQLKMDFIAKQRATNNFRKFWKATGKMDTKPGLPVSVGGMNDPEGIANMFMKHFKVRSPLGPSVTMTGAESCREGGEPVMYFSAKQVGTVIQKMSRGKSPGHDGLSIEHFKYAGVHLPRVLSLFYSFCISHSYLPAELMKTVVVPIVKNRTGDISDKGNYRPISLATTIAKILDSMLDSCLKKHLCLHDAQFGFQPELSTESAILSLKNTVQYYTDRKTPVYACFLDLSRAFDLVSYDVLWRKLGDRNVPAEVRKILQYWYTNQTNNVKWSNTLSGTYGLECGVRQGGLTSPGLFNLYVNDLIVELSSMRVGCRVGGVNVNSISYADDMVLLGPTADSIADMLKVCENYAAAHGLVYNVKKCEYMVFKAAGKCTDYAPNLTLNGLSIKRVKTFKYLGHILTDDLRDNLDIERERRALAVRGNMVARRFSRCTDQVKITLFKAYCQGLYTGGLWTNYTKKPLDVLRVQYNNIFRVLLGLPRFCSASEMFAQNRTDGFHAIIRKKVASLVTRTRASSNSILKTVSESFYSPIVRHFVERMAR